MDSPYWPGTAMSEAYSSRHMDILHEQIKMTHLDVYQAKFSITYTIKSDRSGWPVPLIFDTMTDRYGENGEFKVWVDDKEVSVYRIPSSYEEEGSLRWMDSLDYNFSYSQDNVPNLIGLKYFEAQLPEGIHTIKVEYTALAGQDLRGSVKEFHYTYNLKPASYWRSFGFLDIEIDATVLDGEYQVNFTGSDSILPGSVSHWHFSQLPQDVLILTFTPRISKFAQIFNGIGPDILTLIFSVLLIILHVQLIFKYRVAHPDKKYSPVVIIGSIFLPIVFCLIFMLSFSLVDLVIGEFASGRHGYIFIIFFIYPVLMPVYWVVMWLIDRYKKRKLHTDVL
jgi:hypothetical protein